MEKSGIDCCDQVFVHEELVEKVNKEMPMEEELYDLAELFKVFGDSTRIRILFVLFEAEVCVCDLAEVLHMTQSAGKTGEREKGRKICILFPGR